MKTKDFFGKIFSLKLWANLFAMLLVVVLLCWGVKFGIDIYTHHGEKIKIPDVRRMLLLMPSTCSTTRGCRLLSATRDT